MKLLVFAHVPPPYHGQSAAVQQMLEHFGGNRRKRKFRRQPVNRFGIECYHVNARLSKSLEEIGEFQLRKFDKIFFYCLQAIWCRFRYGVRTLYYVPAPGKAVALYRDWLVMLFCRPFFKKIIFHWHGGGLSKWLETSVQLKTRSLTYRLMGNADLSVVLTEFGRPDAEKLLPRRLAVIGNGLADPCPDFDDTVLPGRRARAAALKSLLSRHSAPAIVSEVLVNVLFLATCSRDKGLFDALEGVRLANLAADAQNSPLRFRLVVAGTFASSAEEKQFRELIRRHNLLNTVALLGFISGERKDEAFREADIFCFPTYYPPEGQPTCVAEALAFGLPVITTRWRAVPDMLPPGYPGLVDVKSPRQIAEKLRLFCQLDSSLSLRDLFLSRFTLERHLIAMSNAIRSVENATIKDP
ncbi:MAG TPA: glycosyltransferase family 4 protein [Verrucomicrobiae bacterium]|nr:glycosyltransferase family 4 protein [Verrucomicrobiae bacterium]